MTLDQARNADALRAAPGRDGAPRWGRPDRRRLFPGVIARLEGAAGADRGLDAMIAYVLGLADEAGPAGRVDPRCHDGSPVPRFTTSLDDVVAHLRRSLAGWTWTIEATPEIDARIWKGPATPEASGSAWKDDDGRTHMESPPANAAIALTLAMLRAVEMEG